MVTTSLFTVLPHKVFIDRMLMFLCDSMPIRDEQDVEKHVYVEYEILGQLPKVVPVRIACIKW